MSNRGLTARQFSVVVDGATCSSSAPPGGCVLLQRLRPEPVQPHDRVQPGLDLRPHADEAAGGDGGHHDEHQVPEHRGGDPHREL